MTKREVQELNPKNTRFRSIEEIFRNPADKATLTNLVDAAVTSKEKIHLQQETIKQLRDEAKEKLSLNPKMFNYYVAMVYNNDYSARKEALDQLDTLVTTVMGLLPPTHSAFQGGDDNDD